MPTHPRILSLFSGYGGLDAGIQSVLGGEVIAHCEIEPAPARILAHHWPDVPNLGDITQADFTALGPIDVVTGGFPCQDVSLAGRRAGLIRDGDGRTRSGLWGHMLRAIQETRPSLVVAENVRGLLSANADSDVEPCPWCMGEDVGGVGLMCGHSELFSQTWPVSGMTRGGQAFELPTWEPHTGDSVCSSSPHLPVPMVTRGGSSTETVSLLPTPRTSDTNGPGMHGTGGMDLRTAVTLLPTPRASDGEKGGPGQRGSKGDLTVSSAVHLLPTPSVADGMGGHATRSGSSSGENMNPRSGDGNT